MDHRLWWMNILYTFIHWRRRSNQSCHLIKIFTVHLQMRPLIWSSFSTWTPSTAASLLPPFVYSSLLSHLLNSFIKGGDPFRFVTWLGYSHCNFKSVCLAYLLFFYRNSFNASLLLIPFLFKYYAGTRDKSRKPWLFPDQSWSKWSEQPELGALCWLLNRGRWELTCDELG